MTTFGLTEQGLFPPRLADLREEYNARLRVLFGAALDLSDESVEGEVAGILSEALDKIWQLVEIFAGALDPDKALGVLLDAVCLLTGTLRRAPTFSVVTLTLTGDPTTIVPGTTSKFSTGNESAVFQTIGDATIEAVDAWTALTAYAVGDRVTSVDRVYQVAAGGAGTSAASGGPTFPDGFGGETVDDDEDGTVHWRLVGDGTGAVDKIARCTVTGPTFSPARGVSVIDTPITGLQSVVNLADVTPGTNQQRDEDLRLTREAELSAQGTSPPDALRGRLLRVGRGTNNPVTAATVFFNNTDITDADGVLPHTVEALVSGGEDADIFAALWAGVSSGIRTQGTTEGTIVDSQGRTQDVAFSRPEEIEIYVDVTLEKDPEAYPSDGDDQVKEAIVTYGLAQVAGKNVVASRIAAAAFAIPGVLDVSAVLIDDAPAPATSMTIAVSLRQIAKFDTARIDVTTSDGVP